jgi:hypothetical protein
MTDEQLSRELSALKESVVDFRNEMRAAMAGFVRQDVYSAQQETLKAQMRQELEAMRGELNAQRGKVEALEADRRQNRGIAVGALASAAVALIGMLFSFK